jgi:hypothetical protein
MSISTWMSFWYFSQFPDGGIHFGFLVIRGFGSVIRLTVEQTSNDYFKKVIEYIFEYSEFKFIFQNYKHLYFIFKINGIIHQKIGFFILIFQNHLPKF